MGKYPDDEEAEIYDISRDFPVFMSVADKRNNSEEYVKYLKKTNVYFEKNYV